MNGRIAEAGPMFRLDKMVPLQVNADETGPPVSLRVNQQ